MSAEIAETTPVVVETTPVAEPITSVEQAARLVIKNAIVKDGVITGLHKVAAALSAKTAKFVFLAEDCDEAAIKQLVTALAAEAGVSVVKVPEKLALGEWCGQCKLDADGNARKVVGAACAVITEFGAESEAKEFLFNFVKTQ
eukprot:GDKI01036460.1.p2 GENE.GDKI01036460.1~~GDKI01036460.1.p2  ORF type:complete len:154 (+),score=62.45 GDKI01036460.1:36-464(+)